MAITHRLGALPDLHDARDTIFEAIPHGVGIGAMPSQVDLRGLCSPVRDQGQQGSCTGFALTALREFMENKTKNGNGFVELSPAFVYYEERQKEGTLTNCDAGARIRDGLKTLNHMGVCPEVDDPYVDTACAAPGNMTQAIHDANEYTISGYQRVTTLAGLKQALAAQQGCVLGIAVYSNFENLDANYVVPMPTPQDTLEGGHAIFCCGYQDDATVPGGGFLWLKNSWGPGYGDQGYIKLPYAYVTPKLVSDMWAAD